MTLTDPENNYENAAERNRLQREREGRCETCWLRAGECICKSRGRVSDGKFSNAPRLTR